jgi:hypothetical protein
MDRTVEFKDLSKLALYLDQKFQGKADLARYETDRSPHTNFLDIITTRHPDHVTYIGTIGCSMIPIQRSQNEPEDWRIEFVTAINEDSEEILTDSMLSLVTMMSHLENNCCYPGLVIRDAFPEECPSPLKHLLLVYPFLWEDGLPSISVKNTQIRFLQLLPISDAEADFVSANGYDAFEDKLAEAEVLYNDFYRQSCV